MSIERKRLLTLALIATALALIVIQLGVWTRLRDAGLGCPDWPGCYGYIHVPVTAADQAAANALFPDSPVEAHRAWPEMIHRYFVGGLSLLIAAIGFMAWRAPARLGLPKRLPYALIVLVIAQAMFGMWTVTWKLWPQVVTTHLLGGMATASLLWLLALRLGWSRPRPGSTAPPWSLGLLALVVVVLQIKLGGWTASNYAALACPDFPQCQGSWSPPMDFGKGFNFLQGVGPNYLGGLLDNSARVAIHVMHRIGAVLVVLGVAPLVFGLLRSTDDVLRHLGLAVLGIVTLQWSLGIANVALSLPLGIGIAHNGVAAVLLLTLVSVNYRLFLHHRSRA